MPSFQRLPSILTLLSVLSISVLLPACAQVPKRGDDAMLEMHQAWRKMDRSRLSALLPQVQGHTLEPLAAYWELRSRLDTASEGEIQTFLTRYAGSYYEDRLRNDWLQLLGRRRDWSTIAVEFPKYRMQDDREVRCYALAADAVLSRRDVAQEALRLWYAQRDADDGCTWLAEHLHSGKKINGVELWRRARIAMDANRPKPAQAAVDIEAPRLSEQVALIHADPVRYLDKRIIAITRNRKELAVLALIRLADDQQSEMGKLIDDEILNTFAVVGEPESIAPELTQRYGDVIQRISFYAPYASDPDRWAAVMAALRAA